MFDENQLVKVISGFVDFTKIFNIIYVNKKESKKDIHKVYEELDNDVNNLVTYLVKEFDLIGEKSKNVDKKIEALEEIKKTIIKLEGRLGDESISTDEFSNIDEELVTLKKKIKENDGVYKDKEEIESDRFDCKEMNSFFENLNFFLKLSYSLVRIYEFEINEIEFNEINKGLSESDNSALMNMMYIIKYKHYSGMGYNDEFINDFFNIQQFYTLLALSNNSLKLKKYEFDNSTNLDEEISEKDHFNLLKIQNFVLLILSKLSVKDNKYERKVAHYTNLNVATMLSINKSHLRLNSVDFMNDPTEGKILKEFLNLKEIYDDNPHLNTFLTCFTFNHNSLNQFRLYGNTNDIECSGVSLVFNKMFFAQGFEKATTSRIYYKLPIFRCIYIDHFSGYFEIARRNKFTFYQEYKDKIVAEKNWKDYYLSITLIEKKIRSYINEIQPLVEDLYNKNDLKIISLINGMVNPLRFLIKHFAFQEEQECRMMRIENIENNEVVFDFKNNKSYIDYKLNSNRYLVNIYMGEKCKLNYTYIIKEIKKSNLGLPKIRISDNPYRSEKKDFLYNA